VAYVVTDHPPSVDVDLQEAAIAGNVPCKPPACNLATSSDLGRHLSTGEDVTLLRARPWVGTSAGGLDAEGIREALDADAKGES